MSAVQQIPLNENAPWYSFNVTLSQVRYRMEVRYNVRMGRWMLSLRTAAGVPIVSGVPLLIQRSLLANYATRAVPPGPLAVFDLTSSGAQPGLASFLTDHVLTYLDPNA